MPENRIGALLKEAKESLGVKTDSEFHRRTGVPYAVITHWKKGDVDPMDSKLKNVAILCDPLGMNLQQIYDYLATGERPKKVEALASPAVTRAYTKMLAAVDEMGRSLGVASFPTKGALIVESSPSTLDMTDTDLLEFVKQKLRTAGYEPTEQSLRPFLEQMTPIDQKEAMAVLDGRMNVTSENEAIILPILSWILRRATGNDDIGNRELVAKLREPASGDR